MVGIGRIVARQEEPCDVTEFMNGIAPFVRIEVGFQVNRVCYKSGKCVEMPKTPDRSTIQPSVLYV
jgi:hypothetical protein